MCHGGERAAPDDVETLVALSFRDLGESTEVALTQGLFRIEARRALHRDGWSDSTSSAGSLRVASVAYPM